MKKLLIYATAVACGLFVNETSGAASGARTDFEDFGDRLAGRWIKDDPQMSSPPASGVAPDHYRYYQWDLDKNLLETRNNGFQRAARTFFAFDRVDELIRAYHVGSDGMHWQSRIVRENGNRWKWTFTHGGPMPGKSVSGSGSWNFNHGGHTLVIDGTFQFEGDDHVTNHRQVLRRLSPLAADEEAKAMVEDFMAEFVKHWKAKDHRAMASMFTKDAVRAVSLFQHPIVGRDEIAKSFRESFGKNGASDGSELSVSVIGARRLTDSSMFAYGTFDIKTGDADRDRHGKWGNVYVREGGVYKCQQGSAHAYLGLEELTSRKSAPERLPMPPAFNKTDPKVLGMLNRCIDRFVRANHENPSLLINEFTANGIRVLSENETAQVGRREIGRGIANAYGDGSPFVESILDVRILGVKIIAEDLFIANGLWSVADAKGKLIDFGQWGNLFVIEGKETRMIMESAGSYWGH